MDLLERPDRVGKMLEHVDHAHFAETIGLERPREGREVMDHIDPGNFGAVDVDPSAQDIGAAAQVNPIRRHVLVLPGSWRVPCASPD